MADELPQSRTEFSRIKTFKVRKKIISFLKFWIEASYIAFFEHSLQQRNYFWCKKSCVNPMSFDFRVLSTKNISFYSLQGHEKVKRSTISPDFHCCTPFNNKAFTSLFVSFFLPYTLYLAPHTSRQTWWGNPNMKNWDF